MMDIAVLAKSLTVLLSPLLPSLLQAGGKAVDAAASKLGTDAWERAKAVWTKLQPKVAAKPAAQEAVEDVAKSPEDPDAQAALRQQLKKLLSEDAAFAQELAQLLESAAPATAGTSINQTAGEIQQRGGHQAIQFGQVGQAGDLNIQQ